MMNSILNLKDQPNLEITCNWDSNIPGKTIQDTVLMNYNDKENDESKNLTDMVNVKTTVNLINSEKDCEKPIVSIKIPQSNININSIVLLCDCKTIEIFGDHDIYVNTIHGTTIEETDEFYVYEYEIHSDQKINKEVCLKFIRLARSNALWIYGILLKLKKVDQNLSSINYDTVQELLKNSHISEQANKAFNFVRDANMSARFSASGEGTIPKLYDNVQPQFGDIKQYIDYKFQILMDYLIMREKNMNDKMDRILEVLKSRN